MARQVISTFLASLSRALIGVAMAVIAATAPVLAKPDAGLMKNPVSVRSRLTPEELEVVENLELLENLDAVADLDMLQDISKNR
jgi:hypothetical protein